MRRTRTRFFEPGSQGFRGGWLRFGFVMVVPCLLIVYLLYEQWSIGDMQAHYAGLREDWPEFVAVMQFLTNWGNIAFYPVYAWILLRGLRHKRSDLTRFAWVYLVVQLLISFALVRLLKYTLGCPRPDADVGLFGFCLPLSLDAGHHALPSGHTAELVGAVAPLVMSLRSWLPSILSGFFVALMGYSRVFLGWHSPADVAFGLVFGGYAAWLIYIYGREQ